MNNANQVLIIGAGAAGLAAARDLAAAGLKVIVIEARGRVGGRINSLRDGSPIIPAELGAEFVHGKHPQLLEIIESSQIPICDVTDRHWYFENGVLSNSHDFWNKLTALMDLMNPEQPDRSFKEFLDSLPNDEATVRAKAVATRYVEGFHAGDIHRIGVHGLIKANEAADKIDGDKSFRVLGGYDSVTNFLSSRAKEHGAVIHLNTIVKEIHWTNNQVDVLCTSGEQAQRFQGSSAVITLPLGVLQARPDETGAVRFIPELPKEKQAAINGVAMGHAMRITMHFRERFWEWLDLPGTRARENLSDLGFIHYPDAPIPTWWTLLPVRAPVMMGWVGGPKAEHFMGRGEDYITSQALASLGKILGVSEKMLRELLVSSQTHDWSADPFSRGAYAYLPVGGVEAQETLARSLNNTLFFAGEATAAGYIGTVDGAVESGERAAKEILTSQS